MPRRILALAPTFPFICISGRRKAGKSTTVGSIAEYYLKKGYVVLDLWAAMDRENGFWAIGDIYYVVWIITDGRLKLPSEMRLTKFCRKFLGTNWLEIIKDPTTKKRTRQYTIELESENKIVLKSKRLPESIELEVSADKTKATLRHIQGGNIKSHDFQISFDKYNNIRIHFPNPMRRDNSGRTIGYPILIIVSEATKIIQNNPLCVCGRPMKDHPQHQKEPAKELIERYPCKLKDQPLIKTIEDTKPFDTIIKMAMREKRVVVVNRGFYPYELRDRPYALVHNYLRLIPWMVNDKVIPTNVNICLILRELSSLVPSGLKDESGKVGKGITDVKRSLQGFLKEARHFRTVVITDYQTGNDILGSVLDKRDYLIVKNSTEESIPDNFKWLYKEIRRRHAYAQDSDDANPYPLIEDLQPWQAYVVFPEGKPPFELRTTKMPTMKHKEPYDDWEYLANADIVHDPTKLVKTPVRGKSGARTVSEADLLRDRAFQKIDELMGTGMTWDEMAKAAGLINKKTGKIAEGEAARVAYNRWKKQQEEPPAPGDAEQLE